MQLVDRTAELQQGRVGIVHRDRRETEEPPAVFRRELGVRVVRESRDFGLRLSLDEVHVRCRKRQDLGVDANAVHVLEAFGHVGHRSGDPKEACSLEPDDPLTGRACPEREVAAAPLDTFEVRRRVIVRM